MNPTKPISMLMSSVTSTIRRAKNRRFGRFEKQPLSYLHREALKRVLAEEKRLNIVFKPRHRRKHEKNP